jgi:dephospho-CoA kinase
MGIAGAIQKEKEAAPVKKAPLPDWDFSHETKLMQVRRRALVAVCGYRGSGKSVFGEAARELGWHVIEMSQPVLKLMDAQGIGKTNESVREFATKLREEKGPAAVAEMVLADVREAMQNNLNVAIIGIRSMDEISVLRKAGEVMCVAIVSPEKARFERVHARGRAGDPQTLKEFKWSDSVEDTWGLAKVVKNSVEKIANRGSLDKFREKCIEFLNSA